MTVNSPHKRPVTLKQFDDNLMTSSYEGGVTVVEKIAKLMIMGKLLPNSIVPFHKDFSPSGEQLKHPKLVLEL